MEEQQEVTNDSLIELQDTNQVVEDSSGFVVVTRVDQAPLDRQEPLEDLEKVPLEVVRMRIPDREEHPERHVEARRQSLLTGTSGLSGSSGPILVANDRRGSCSAVAPLSASTGGARAHGPLRNWSDTGGSGLSDWRGCSTEGTPGH